MMTIISRHKFLTGIYATQTYKITARGISTDAEKRKKLLHNIYSPAFAGVEKDSQEYNSLAESGKVWENYFQPGRLEPYLKAQEELKDTLKLIDNKRDVVRGWTQRYPSFIQNLTVDHAWQSTKIEHNSLSLEDAREINCNLNRCLDKELLFETDTGPNTPTTADMSHMDLPAAETLLRGRPKTDILEVRNHIVTSRFATKLGQDNPRTAGFSLEEILDIAKMMLRDTDAQLLYSHGWGKRVPFGSFRTTPIGIKSNPLRIFPYHVEVPGCMANWIQWRNKCHENKVMHPIILATHIASYFVHIHPFPDGNGRLSRVVMADYLVRQGHLPIGFVSINSEVYLKAQSAAQDGKPGTLCALVCQTQLQVYERILKEESMIDEFNLSLDKSLGRGQHIEGRN